MKRYEVRCCCRPEKLLGWLDAQENAVEIRYVMMSASIGWAPSPSVDPVRTEEIRLPIDMIRMPDGRMYRAIKSEETTLETLRRIPGFIENVEMGITK